MNGGDDMEKLYRLAPFHFTDGDICYPANTVSEEEKVATINEMLKNKNVMYVEVKEIYQR
jgi:hypothetical protein